MTIEVIINGTKHVERVEKRNMYVHDFSAIIIVVGIKKNGLRPQFLRSFSFLFPLSLPVCFRYCLPTLLYTDESRQTNRHHGYIVYTDMIHWSIYDVHANVLLYLHSCTCMYVCDVAETRVVLLYVHTNTYNYKALTTTNSNEVSYFM